MELLYRALLHIPVIVSFLIFLGGALECFFGYKIFRIQIALVGFAVGFMLGGTVSALFATESLPVLIAAVVTGLVCALLAYKMYLVGAFITAFFMGTLLFGMGAMIALEDTAQSVAIGAVAGVLIGIVAVRMVKPVIIIATAATGACAMSTQLMYMVDSMGGSGYVTFSGEYFVLATCFVVFLVLGIIVQLATTRKAVKAEPVAEPAPVEEPKPAVEPAPVVEEPAPVEEVVEPTPVEEPQTVSEEPTAAEEPAPEEEPVS